MLDVLYAAGSGSNPVSRQAVHRPMAGGPFALPLPGGSGNASAVRSYWVKFDPAFEWVKGGKMPGLCGNDCSTGGDAVYPNRFSIRYMWRGGGAGEVYSYLSYSPNPGYGLTMGVGPLALAGHGRWHHVQEERSLETPAIATTASSGLVHQPLTARPTFEQKTSLLRSRAPPEPRHRHVHLLDLPRGPRPLVGAEETRTPASPTSSSAAETRSRHRDQEGAARRASPPRRRAVLTANAPCSERRA